MSINEYFNDLNYSLANEDSELEREIVHLARPYKCVSVCGAGSRCTALLNESINEMYCVDLSNEQLYLAELRFESIRKLSFEEFLKFWGYAPYTDNDYSSERKQLFSCFEISSNARAYLKNVFDLNSWNSLLYTGKWEKTFIKFSAIVRFVLGKKLVRNLFEFRDINSQVNYINNNFPQKRWKLIMLILGNKAIFNKLLYKGNFIKKNVRDSYLSYYSKAYKKLMSEHLFRRNFFLQLCFLGKVYYKEANPPEAQDSSFHAMKNSLRKTKVKFINKDIIGFLNEQSDVDFVSISDVPSYFSGELEVNYLQKIKLSLSPDAIIVNRNYLRVPNSDKSGFSLINDQFENEINKEQVQMYRVEVFKNEN